jgi:hypothetical protein
MPYVVPGLQAPPALMLLEGAQASVVSLEAPRLTRIHAKHVRKESEKKPSMGDDRNAFPGMPQRDPSESVHASIRPLPRALTLWYNVVVPAGFKGSALSRIMFPHLRLCEALKYSHVSLAQSLVQAELDSAGLSNHFSSVTGAS